MPDACDILRPPARPDAGHKGTFGTVIVVGGCATMIGAPAICARAAFRAGAGLVKLATPAAVLPYALNIEPGATGVVLTGDAESDAQAIEAADASGGAVLAVGPGMGQGDAPRELVMALLAGARPVVLDADGLNALASWLCDVGRDAAADAVSVRDQKANAADNPPLILTPHPGEFRRLAQPLGITADPTNPAQRTAAATALAEALHAVVLLKGRHTVVTDGRRISTNTTGNPALATAGSGDVLTGLTSAMLAQGMPAYDAAVLAAFAHGSAADAWAAQHGPSGMRSQDLADGIPDALNEARSGD